MTEFLHAPQALLLRPPEDLHCGYNKLDLSASFHMQQKNIVCNSLTNMTHYIVDVL